MNMKRQLFLILILAMPFVLIAKPVGKDAAKEKAAAFLSQKSKTRSVGELKLADSQPGYHVFNVGSEGFVIISADDCAPDVLGYSDTGSFDTNNIPENMKAWLKGYADQINWMKSQGYGKYEQPATTRAGIKRSISPLIATSWDQDNPYNLACPDFFSDGKCVTGCVATAMAQVLYYLGMKTGFPTGTTMEIPAYDIEYTDLGQVHVDAIPQSVFEWSRMKLQYTGDESASDEAAAAVARLMACCGSSVGMNYGMSSGASSGRIPEALKMYFGFDNSVQYRDRRNFSTTDWEDMIYNELEEERPVLYGGQSSGGGHAFVCDGFDDDLFHINWGWSGSFNGYFRLSVLNPYGSGSGGSSSSDGYSMDQDIIIGIQEYKGNNDSEDGILSVNSLGLNGNSEINRSGSNPIPYSFIFKNDLSSTYSFDIALGVYDDNDELKGYSGSFSVNNMSPGVTISGTTTTSISNNLFEAGKSYKLKLVSKVKNTDSWFKCFWADEYYLRADVTDGKITLTAVAPVVNLQASDIALTTDGLVNSAQTIKAKIANNSTSLYRDNVYLFVDDEHVSGNSIDVNAGGTTSAYFTFLPTEAGTKHLKITTDEEGQNVIGTATIDILGVSGAETSDDVELTLSIKVENAVTENNTKYVLGNKAKLIVTAINNTDTNFKGSIGFLRYYWDGNNASGSGSSTTRTVMARSKASFEYETDLTIDETYSFVALYVKGGTQTYENSTIYDYYIAKPAIKIYTSDGGEILTLAKDSYTVSSTANAVDLRESTNVSSFDITNANPNCLYLLSSAAGTPTDLNNANVIKGTKAENIELTDGYDFYSPITFTADKISYKRAFEGYNTQTNQGWTTICLPFKVGSITVDGQETPIDWFNSQSDTGKNFWLMGFSNDAPGVVNFNYVGANSFEANTPYIMTVPGNDWGDEWNLAGKDLIFSGENVTVEDNARTTLNGGNFKFCGSYIKSSLQDVYALNSEGDCFEKTSSAQTVNAFRAYFTDVNKYAHYYTSSLNVGFNNYVATQILNTKFDRHIESNDVYNLQGVKVASGSQRNNLPKGIYIINGKKVIIK